jgi:hypothetical protein
VLPGPGCYPTSLGRGARTQVDGPVARVRWSLALGRRCAPLDTFAQTTGPAGPAESLPSGNGFSVPDDAQVARPGLQPVKRCLDVG